MTIYVGIHTAENDLWIKTRDVAVRSPNRARILGAVGQTALTIALPIAFPLATLELLIRTIVRSCAYRISHSNNNLLDLNNVSCVCWESIKETLSIPLTVIVKIMVVIKFVLFPMYIAARAACVIEIDRFVDTYDLTPFMCELLQEQTHLFLVNISSTRNYHFFGAGNVSQDVKFANAYDYLVSRENLFTELSSTLAVGLQTLLRSDLCDRSKTIETIRAKYSINPPPEANSGDRKR